MTTITIPYAPRPAFAALHHSTSRWACIVAHRRAGKTVACINHLIRAALTSQRADGRYAYIAPFYRQAKNVAWDYLKRFSAPIPGIAVNESELRIDYPNGSRITLYGADNADALRGLYYDGIICDEYGDWRPSVWAYVIRPTLADRTGWAIIIGTPKGRNQFYDAHTLAQSSDDWLSLVIQAGTSGILPPDELASMRSSMTGDAWRQEMECDFDAALPGAIYGADIWQAEQDGRVRADIYDPALKTHAVFDLGYSDDTAIWWFQVASGILRIVDCYSAHGEGIQHYHDVLRAKPYQYGEWLWLPHDARAKSLAANGRSIEQQFSSLGWRVRIVPELGLVDGIQAARLTLASCLIDTRCAEGIQALKQYQREYDEDKKAFRDKPRHDWTSHYCLHPDTYILTRYGMRRIIDLPKSGEVLTSCGWKTYVNPRITRRNAPLVEVLFKDGLTVKCTREHMFKTVSGWKCAEHLLPGTPIQSSLTRLRSISMAVYSACGRVKSIYHEAARSCIEQFGSQPLEMFRRGATYTTSTATQPTTHYQTLSVCRPENTLAIEAKLIPVESAIWHVSERKSGTSRMPVGYGTNDTPNVAKDGLSGSVRKRTALFVATCFKRLLEKADALRFIALTTAKPLLIEGVTHLSETSDVWCLTVPDAGEFSLANGAVVHNSDAFRYACLVWRKEMAPKPKPEPKYPLQMTINEIIAANRRKRLASE